MRNEELIIKNCQSSVMKRAIFPGTFDPFTIGHYSVVKRALTFMDEIIIGIGVNDKKKTWFPTEKRVEMIRKLYADGRRIQGSRHTTTLPLILPASARPDSLSAASVPYTTLNTKKPLPTSTASWPA